MADNVAITAGSGTTIATDDVGGVHYQISKNAFGALDTATLVTASVGLPENMLQVGNTSVNAFPAGFQRTSDEPRQMFYDPFDAALDTTNRWVAPTSAGGGVAAVVASGSLTLGSGTTINGYSYLTSQPSFTPSIPAWISNSWAISIEFAVGNNAVRFWGCGIVGGTPSSTSPLGATGDGFGFELDITGVLQAVVYATGVRTVVSSLAALQPADNALHRYICFYRTDRIYWYIDGLGSAQLAATSNFQSPAVQTLPLLVLAVAHSSAPAASRVITCAGLAMSDTGKNSSMISDGTYPWRKVQVGKTGGLAVRGASLTSTSGSIAAAGTGTIGPLDVSEAGNVTFTVKNTVAASAYAGAPVLVFEQSDDGVSYGPLLVVRSDTALAASTFTLAANTASASLMFDAGVEGVTWVRCRVTTGPATNAMTVAITQGGMPFSPLVAVAQATLTKGTQGSTGITAQDLKDAGRSARTFTLEAFNITATAETIMTMSYSTDNGTLTTGTTYSVTTGKRLRIQSITLALHTVASNTTATSIIVRIRAVASGSAIVTSPLQGIFVLPGQSVANLGNTINIPFPDGWEFQAGSAFAVTEACAGYVVTTAAPKLDVSIVGYEY